MGRRLDSKDANSLLRVEKFDKSMLEPVYVLDTSSESVDIESMLEKTKVLQYGSFVYRL